MREVDSRNSHDISVETALNSRCAGDADGDQARYHWGLYDVDADIPPEVFNALGRGVQIPRFTYYPLDVNLEDIPVVFAMSAEAAGWDRKRLHVESGMQQQAFHLVCAAFGVGTCVLNMGIEGKQLSESQWGTVRMDLHAMRPSYGDSFWTVEAPDDWVCDHGLPAPNRAGRMPLQKAFEEIGTDAGGRGAELQDLSQLLWAARGRTPHLAMGRRWGMTIPTWGGGQSIASLYAVTGEGAFRYINSRDERATHALDPTGRPCDLLEPGEYARVIMGINEGTGRACWEVGYMMENLLLQSASLGIRYAAELLDEDASLAYEAGGIVSPLAMLTVFRD